MVKALRMERAMPMAYATVRATAAGLALETVTALGTAIWAAVAKVAAAAGEAGMETDPVFVEAMATVTAQIGGSVMTIEYLGYHPDRLDLDPRDMDGRGYCVYTGEGYGRGLGEGRGSLQGQGDGLGWGFGDGEGSGMSTEMGWGSGEGRGAGWGDGWGFQLHTGEKRYGYS